MKKLYYLLFIIFSTSTAQWPTTVDGALFVDYGIEPMLAVDDNEQSVIVAYIQSGDYIKVKKFNKFGYPEWGGNAVIAAQTLKINEAGNVEHTISDDSGGVIICWEDFRNSDFDSLYGWPLNSEIYIQRIDINGNIRYGINGTRISGPSSQGYHIIGDMKKDYHDGFVVTIRNDSTGSMSVAKRFDKQLNLIWEKYFNELGIDLNVTDRQGNIFISTYTSSVERRFKFDINGNSLWPDTLNGIIPDAVSYRGGGAFSDYNGGAIGVQGVFPNKMYVNRVDSTGEFVFGNGIYIRPVDTYKYYETDSLGGIFLNWGSFDGEYTLYAQHISVNGKISWDSSGIILCSPPNCLSTRGIVTDQKFGIITAWASNNNLPEKTFYIQRIDSSGDFLWNSTALELYRTSDDPTFIGPVRYLFSDRRGGAIMCWINSGAGLKIMLKQISYDGIIGKVDTMLNIKNVSEYFPDLIELKQNYPNPFNSETIIKYEIIKSTKVEISIYNVLGQKIKNQINENKKAGKYYIKWNGRNENGNKMPSGIYYCRLQTDQDNKVIKMLLIN